MPSFEKELILKEIKENIEGCQYVFISQFNKLTVSDVSGLRKGLRKITKRCLVTKNTVAKKAFEQLGMNDLSACVSGQMMIASCDENPQDVSKVLVQFAKEKEETFKINGAWIEGNACEVAYVKKLASLPSKQELLTKVVVGMKFPITGFVLTLNGVLRSFAVVLNQIALQKEQA